jgi:hypothetical protein
MKQNNELMKSMTAEKTQKLPEPEPIERIADALDRIANALESLDQSLIVLSDMLSDCQVKNTYGSALAITGSVEQV